MTAQRTLTMALATGETRPVTSVGDDGAFSCPWCGGYCSASATKCENPACWASPFWTAANVRAAQDRRAQADRVHAERVQRERSGAAHAQAGREAREQKWVELAQQADARDACLTCLRKSDWQYGRPRFVKHRRADFHAEAGTR